MKDGTSVGGWCEVGTEVVVDAGDHGKGPEGLGLTERGKGEVGVEGIGGRDDELEPKGGGGGGGGQVGPGGEEYSDWLREEASGR